jgi:hypothetical protein
MSGLKGGEVERIRLTVSQRKREERTSDGETNLTGRESEESALSSHHRGGE